MKLGQELSFPQGAFSFFFSFIFLRLFCFLFFFLLGPLQNLSTVNSKLYNMRTFRMKRNFKSKYRKRTIDDDLIVKPKEMNKKSKPNNKQTTFYKPFKRPAEYEYLPERITHDKLIDKGFEYSMKIYRLKGISVQKLNSYDSTWRACKGMMDEVNLNNMNDLSKFMDKHCK